MKKIILGFAISDLIFITLFNGVFETWQSYASDGVLFILFVIALVILLKEGHINKYTVSVEVLLFALTIAILPIFSYYKFVSLHVSYDILAALSAFFIFANLTDKTTEKFMLYGLLTAGLIAAGIGYAGYVAVASIPHSHLATYFVSHSFIQGKRIASSFQYPNTFGAFLILPFFIAIGLITAARSKIERAFLYIFASFILSILYFTQSRGAEITFLFALIIFTVFTFKNKKLWISIFTVTILAGIFIVLNNYFLSNVVQQNAQRVKVLVSFVAGEQNRSLYDRIVLAKDAANIFLHHPIFGTGFETFRYAMTKYRFNLFYARFPHSVLFRLLAESGIVGTVIFFYTAGILFAKALKKNTNNLLKIAVFVGTLGIFLHMLLDIDFAFPVMQIMLFSGIAFCLFGSLKEVKLSPHIKHATISIFSVLVISVLVISVIPRISAIAFANGGDTEIQKNNLHAALQSYTIATRLENGNADFHDKLGYTYEKIAYETTNCNTYLENALNEYKLAEHINTMNFTYPLYISHILLLKKDSKAPLYTEKSLLNNPLWKPICAEVALAYAYTGKNAEKAEENAKAALNFKATDEEYKSMRYTTMKEAKSTALTALGFCNIEGNEDRAKTLFEEALKLNPKNGFASLGLANFYENNRNIAKACEYLYSTLHISPCLQEAREKYFSTAPLIVPETKLSNQMLKAGKTVELHYAIKNSLSTIDKIVVYAKTDNQKVELLETKEITGTLIFTMPRIKENFRIIIECVDNNGKVISRIVSPVFSKN